MQKKGSMEEIVLQEQENTYALDRIRTREQKIAEIQKFTLFSDTFLSVALEDLAACQYVLRILTGEQELVLKKVKSQYAIQQLAPHDARLDVLAEDVEGKLYELEIQQRNTVDHPRRVRFYESMVDANFLLKGENYVNLPEVHFFYIGARDFQQSGMTMWEVIKQQSGTLEMYEDGLHTTYINAEIDDGSEIARLMRYFKTADPDDASAGALSERVHFLKSEERGREIMCEVTERFWQWGYESGEKAGYENGEKAGYAIGAKDGERRGQRRGERRGERRGARRGRDRIIRTYIKASMEEGCTREQVAERLQRYFALSLEQIGKYMADSGF